MKDGVNIETAIQEEFKNMFKSKHVIYVSGSYLNKFSKELPKETVPEKTQQEGRKRLSAADKKALKKERNNLKKISNVTLQDAGYYSSDEDYSEQDQIGGESNTKMDPITYSVIAIGTLVGVLLGIK